MLLLRGPRGLISVCVLLIFVTSYCYSLLSFRQTEVVAPPGTDLKFGAGGGFGDLGASFDATPGETPIQTDKNEFESDFDSTSDNVDNEEANDPESTEEAPSSAPPSVSPKDVLLIVKTGASTVWRRMPIQLTTTLSNVPHSIVYSDANEPLTFNISTVDAIANISKLLETYDPAAYTVYTNQKASIHSYREQSLLPGDEVAAPDGNTPGWVLDRYKFLPMLAHAAQYHPDFKWYIYIEDDTYVFWPAILRWLATVPSDDEPVYYGAFSGEGNDTFAQGGSGIAFSRSLMQTIFTGSNVPTIADYANFTAEACCGDMVLGKVLRDYDIQVNNGSWGPISFRPEPPWKTAFDELLWCQPVFTFHHLHQRDLVLLSQMEKEHGEEKPLLFRDVFRAFVAPYLEDKKDNWDNFADLYTVTKKKPKLLSSVRAPFPPYLKNWKVLQEAYKNPENCAALCAEVDGCKMWRHEVGDKPEDSTCKLDGIVMLGHGIDVERRPEWDQRTVTSGWMANRIMGPDGLTKETCKKAYSYSE